ncbi:MAG: Isopropylmalate/citramalate isomerase small subunit [Methanobacterium sp. PtaB.Bin024]|nr:MAG: Isopropylmalate/citramalate isomerase small subunit [Methanobacterium sp. PtaB.Bin024]
MVINMENMIRGKVWKFGDDVDTDMILPGRYLVLSEEEELAACVMAGHDSEFSKKVKKGDILVAGKNFGCGSSREHAPIAIKAAGISAVVAESFARIFYRNSTNIGLLLIEAKGISKNVEEGDEIEINMEKGVLEDLNNSKEFEIKPLPEFMMDIMNEGGLISYLKNHLAEIKGE